MVGQQIPVRVEVNGRLYEASVAPHHSLLEFLRDQLHFTGSKECCSCGECGACTVLLDGLSVDSCLVLASEADGKSVTTIEGLEVNGVLDPVQRAFVEKGAVQCGFCIPGMIMSAKDLLLRNPHPSVAEVKEGLAGNLCRCAGYSRIIEAVLCAAESAS
jgi:carbon-monoxide dehydrogenase small subunit